MDSRRSIDGNVTQLDVREQVRAMVRQTAQRVQRTNYCEIVLLLYSLLNDQKRFLSICLTVDFTCGCL